jgi:hypothetical protein
MQQPWISAEAWERASDPNPDADTVELVVCDPELGSLVVLRTPDGREVIGAD